MIIFEVLNENMLTETTKMEVHIKKKKKHKLAVEPNNGFIHNTHIINLLRILEYKMMQTFCSDLFLFVVGQMIKW